MEDSDSKAKLSPLDMSSRALASRLTGVPRTLHKRGIERSDDVLQLYCTEPSTWPIGESGAIIPQVCWTGLPVPLSQANLHFLIAGVPGTGKTLSIRCLLQSVFAATVGPQLGGTDRAVIYDPKQEFFPILRGMGVPTERISFVNPFDYRGFAWDLAEDYQTPAEAFQLAKTMIPCPESHSQPFFPKAAAAILTGVISALMQINARGWDLADVVLNCLDESRLCNLLERATWNPYIQMAKGVLGSGDTKQNVFAELSSQLFEYLPIAARWRSARKRRRLISIREFLETPDRILLLGANQTFSQSLQVINRLFLKRLGELMMDIVADGQWEAKNRTWLVLDELRELGKVPGLGDFVNKGRSRGVCAVLGFQDYPGLKEAFGENNAHEITATCGHRLYLKLGGESAEWAAKSIGKAEIVDTNLAVTSGSSIGLSFQKSRSTTNSFTKTTSILSPSSETFGTTDSFSSGFNINLQSSVTASQQIRESDAVLASEISGLPNFVEGRGISGFVCQRSHDGKPVVRKLHFPIELLQGLHIPNNEPGFIGWPEAELEW